LRPRQENWTTIDSARVCPWLSPMTYPSLCSLEVSGK
jgi:hypothetical protein